MKKQWWSEEQDTVGRAQLERHVSGSNGKGTGKGKHSGSCGSRDQSRTTATKSGTTEYIPSFRLKEEAERRRKAEAKDEALEQRIAELERVIRAGRLREASSLKPAG